VHQLAAAHLKDDDVRASTEAAHAAYFHRMLTQLRRQVMTGERPLLTQVDAEFENCRLAWHWAVGHGAGALLQGSVDTLHNFSVHRGRGEDVLALVRAALEHKDPAPDAATGVRLLANTASLEYMQDRYGEAVATATRALESADPARDPQARLQGLRTLGSCSLRLGRYADARRYFKQALKLLLANGDGRGAAGVLDNLALVEKRMGHWDESRKMSMQALEQFRQLGEFAGEALCLNNLGSLLLDLGELEAGTAHLKAALELADRHSLVSTRAYALASLTEAAFKSGDLDGAQVFGERAIEAVRAAGNRALEAWLGLQGMRIALARKELDRARAELCGAVEVAIATGYATLQLGGVVCFAEVLAAQGDVESARTVLGFATAHPLMTDRGQLDEIAQLHKAWGVEPAGAGPAAGWELRDLAHRIVIETPLAYAPLIAALRLPA
jgi:tetratricopeptide (TPR) repeat protein